MKPSSPRDGVRRRSLIQLAGAGALGLVLPGRSRAQGSYPTQPIRIVSLYQKRGEGDKGPDYGQLVGDLLDEYKRKGKNIEVETVDPVTQQSLGSVRREVAVGDERCAPHTTELGQLLVQRHARQDRVDWRRNGCT